MHSYKSFIQSSSNQESQITSGRNPLPSKPVNVFEYMSSKADLYDHMRYNLQVSDLVITLTLL